MLPIKLAIDQVEALEVDGLTVLTNPCSFTMAGQLTNRQQIDLYAF